MTESETNDGVREIELSSWREFLELATTRFAAAPAIIYRGQANYDWPLRSSLDRLADQFPYRKNLCGKNPAYFTSQPLTEQQHLDAFRRAIRGRRGPNPPHLSDDECWALGQHHGLATPLLDWTRSPFVALFFAFEEKLALVDGRLQPPDFRGVFALSTSSITHPPNPGKESLTFVSPNSDANYRLVSQAAIFVKVPRKHDVEGFVRARFSGETHEPPYTKIKIPNVERDECLVVLSKMNINHMTLFPDLDGAAKHVNSLWQPGHEDSIAYV